MIPKGYWEDISNLICGCPELFDTSGVIGVYTGDSMCACLMNSSNYLHRIVFYENFEDMHLNEISIFKKMYLEWQSNIKNLDIFYTDGYREVKYNNFDFISFDCYTNTYNFIIDNYKEFKKTLLACTDYGRNLKSTIFISKLLDENLIYPVLHDSSVLFFTVDLEKYNEVHSTFEKYLNTNNVPAVNLPFNNKKYLRLNSFYHSKKTKK